MENIMDLVLGLNAQGIALLENDDFDPAIEDLRTALDQIRRISQYTTVGSTPQVSLASHAPFLSERAYRRVQDSGDVILGQGLAVVVENRQDPKLSLQDTSFLTAVLLFNLGLAHHLRGISRHTTAGSHASDLRMALNLYQHAMGFSVEQLVPIDPRIALLLVAMGNNMCSVAASMGKMQDLALAMEWTKIYCKSVAENVPFFWMNVTFWDYLSNTPAPAA